MDTTQILIGVEHIINGLEVVDVIVTEIAGSAAISEALPFVKKVKSNSTLQLICNIFVAIKNVLVTSPEGKNKT